MFKPFRALNMILKNDALITNHFTKRGWWDLSER
ncbi:hypothetical protein N403_04975 [Helicobacter pylori FD430]|nr:hypothetical protein N403_04975 [Helicobacter pylori FD430]